jgi:hypothetical protein
MSPDNEAREPLPPLRPIPLDVKIVRAVTFLILGAIVLSGVVFWLQAGRRDWLVALLPLALLVTPSPAQIPLLFALVFAGRRPWRREVYVAPLFLLEALGIVWFNQARWEVGSRAPFILALGAFPISMIALAVAGTILRRGWRWN